MGLSRDTFYRYKAAVEDLGLAALLVRARRKPILAKGVYQTPEQAVQDFDFELPACG